MAKKCIYLVVIDYVDRSGNSDQTVKAFEHQEAAKALYDTCVKEAKMNDYPEYFDSDGNFKEDEYGDVFVCDEFITAEGESFSFYEDGWYKTEHYTVYWRELEVLA